MKINTQQIKELHTLLSRSGMMEQKADLLLAFSEGRCLSSKDLHSHEAAELIQYLKSLSNTNTGEAANKMRRKIFAMCHRLQWTVPATRPDGTAYTQVDIDRLNGWCLNRSYLKKELMRYKYEELPKLVSEFSNVYKYYISKTTTA